ncbi:MAG: hypothetical protein JWP75_2066 [Frondihabitans sp.]|nr:hypothetical protein [Frondihabitans sp.]
MSDDEQRASRPVTSMSLRAERLRVTMAKASGARGVEARPGLSPAPKPRDPELTNPWAKIGLGVGIFSVFISFFAVPSMIALVFCGYGLGRARALDGRGKGPYGRSRALWGIGLAVFGIAQAAYFLFVAKYL